MDIKSKKFGIGATILILVIAIGAILIARQFVQNGKIASLTSLAGLDKRLPDNAVVNPDTVAPLGTGENCRRFPAGLPTVALCDVPTSPVTANFTVSAHVEGELAYNKIRILVDGIDQDTCDLRKGEATGTPPACVRTIDITRLVPGTHRIQAKARFNSTGVLQGNVMSFEILAP